MRPARYLALTLEALFQKEKVVTLESLKQALGAPSKMTVFRKLQQLDYRASYSHAGRYYTLARLARFDAHGLWTYRQVSFSRYGSLLDTAEALVCASAQGYLSSELERLLQVRVQTPLLALVERGRLRREPTEEGFLYLSPQGGELQLQARQQQQAAARAVADPWEQTPFGDPETRQVLQRFLDSLNEKQRRLYVGFESLKWGHGGDALMSRLTGINVKTVARGRRELLAGNLTLERVRRAGGGRPGLEKKTTSSRS